MVTRNNSRRRTSGTTRQLFGVARLLDTLAQMGAGYIGRQERARIEALRAENLKLKNQIADTQKGVISNRVVEGDLKIELLKLRIREQKQKLGITDSPFVADGYQEPGNIREEERNRGA